MAAGRLRMGLVGAGLVGQAEHAFYLWEDRERFELVALADPSQIVRTSLAARYGIAETRERRRPAVRPRTRRDRLREPPMATTTRSRPAPCAPGCTCCARSRSRSASPTATDIRSRRRRRPRRPGRHHEALSTRPTCACSICCPTPSRTWRYLTVEVNDLDQLPFVAHLPMAVGDRSVPAELVATGASAFPGCGRRGAGRQPVRAEAGAFLELPLVRRARPERGARHPRPVRRAPVAGAPTTRPGGTWPRDVARVLAAWRWARPISCTSTFPASPEYRERLTVYCRDRVLELTFPSPYLRHRSDAPRRAARRRRQSACSSSGAPRVVRGGVPRGAARLPPLDLGGRAGRVRRDRGTRRRPDADRGVPAGDVAWLTRPRSATSPATRASRSRRCRTSCGARTSSARRRASESRMRSATSGTGRTASRGRCASARPT